MTKEMYENMTTELERVRDYYRKRALSYLDEITESDLTNATETDIAIRYLLNTYIANENNDEDEESIRVAAYTLLNAYTRERPKGTHKVGNICLNAFYSWSSSEKTYWSILRYLNTYIDYSPEEGDENT